MKHIYTDEVCSYCNGSGEGMYDGSSCGHCHGGGSARDYDAEREAEYEMADRYYDEMKDRR